MNKDSDAQKILESVQEALRKSVSGLIGDKVTYRTHRDIKIAMQEVLGGLEAQMFGSSIVNTTILWDTWTWKMKAKWYWFKWTGKAEKIRARIASENLALSAKAMEEFEGDSDDYDPVMDGPELIPVPWEANPSPKSEIVFDMEIQCLQPLDFVGITFCLNNVKGEDTHDS